MKPKLDPQAASMRCHLLSVSSLRTEEQGVWGLVDEGGGGLVVFSQSGQSFPSPHVLLLPGSLALEIGSYWFKKQVRVKATLS